MVQITLDNSVGKACLELHQKAYHALSRVLEDLANGKEVCTIGRGGKKIVLARASKQNTVARQYY